VKIEIRYIAINLVGGSRRESVPMYTESERVEAGRSRKDHIVFSTIIAAWCLVGVVIVIRITTALYERDTINKIKIVCMYNRLGNFDVRDRNLRPTWQFEGDANPRLQSVQKIF